MKLSGIFKECLFLNTRKPVLNFTIKFRTWNPNFENPNPNENAKTSLRLIFYFLDAKKYDFRFCNLFLMKCFKFPFKMLFGVPIHKLRIKADGFEMQLKTHYLNWWNANWWRADVIFSVKEPHCLLQINQAHEFSSFSGSNEGHRKIFPIYELDN